MTVLGLLPVVLSFAALAAHFLRGSEFVLLAISLLVLLLLALPRPWAARAAQAALAAAAMEWAWTLLLLVQERIAMGLPYGRSALILGAVAVFTAASVFAFHVPAVRRRYRLG
jgi:hypothetical protein